MLLRARLAISKPLLIEQEIALLKEYNRKD